MTTTTRSSTVDAAAQASIGAAARELLLRADEGRNIRAVQRLLGHSSLAATEIYALGFDADSEKAVLLLPDPRANRTR